MSIWRFCSRSFSEEIRRVLMENPGYPQAYHTFRNMGYRVVTVPADEQGLSRWYGACGGTGACLHDAVPSVPDSAAVMPLRQKAGTC